MADSPDNRNRIVLKQFRTFSFKKLLLIGLPVSLLVFLLVSANWLLNTNSGAAWLWNKIEDTADGAVSSSQVHGNLASGFIIQDLGYRTDGLKLSVGRVEIIVKPGWWPVSVLVETLSVQDVLFVTHSLEVPENDVKEEADIRSVLADLKLPVPLEIHNAVLTNIQLQEDEEAKLGLITSLRFQAELDERLSVDQLNIITPVIEADLQGHLLLKPPYPLAVDVTGRLEITGQTATTALNLPFTLQSAGNLDKLQFDFTSIENGLELNGEVLDPVTGPKWKIEGVMDHLLWPLDDAGETIALSDLSIASQGRISDWSVEMASTMQIGVAQESRLILSGSGSETGMQISKADLTGAGIELGVNGELDWSEHTEAGLKAVITQLDLSPWLADWPAGEYLAGDLELNWSQSGLDIQEGRLTVAGTDLAVNLEADVDIDANLVKARLDWSGLSWPIRDAEPEFSSPAGTLSVNGSVDDWEAEGRVQIQLGEYPQGRFEITGSGGRTSTRLAILSGEVLGGSVSGEAGADWTSGFIWDAAIRTLNVDPEPLLPGWPGSLDTEIVIDASSQPQRFQIDLVSLQGYLRGVAVNGHGGLVVEESNLAFNQLELRTDEASLHLHGAMADSDGLSVKFTGNLPSALLQGASGSLRLDGQFSNNVDQPFLDLQMQALDLAWNGFSIKGLAVNSRESDTAGPLPDIQLNASELVWQDLLIDEFIVNLDLDGGEHRLTASLAAEKLALNSAMTLVPQGGDKLFGGLWDGVLDKLELAYGQAYSFELLKPAPFEWSSDSVLVKPVCLGGKAGAGLCLGADYQSMGDWSVIADVTAVPVDHLRDILELDIHFEQLIEGHLEWHQPHDRAPTGSAAFSISAGRIFESDENQTLVETNEGKFGFVLQNGNLESGDLDIEFPGFGFIDIDFGVLDIAEHGARKLQGRAISKMNNIKILGHLLWPGIDNIGGLFESDIQLGGILSDPEFSGGFKLSKGAIEYTPLGLRLDDIEFQGQVEQHDSGFLKGQFRAGEGFGSINGEFLFRDIEHLSLDLTFSGDELLLINTDSLKMLTEADLRLGLSPQRLDINGRIGVPSAHLTPSNLLLTRVNDSEDLVIENRADSLETEERKAVPEKQVFGQLEVAFGDDVYVKVPGVETNISGSVLFNWNGDPMPLANGNYTLKGKIDVYGPILQINNGSISFPNVPADNPILNIRAERDIYGNTQIGAAGVQLIGTLKRPKLEAYTVPGTNEDRAWTLLITGSDFDQAQGVSGFDVGTYIAPKLYVSYGISLFEDENVVSARYDLKKGFGVKVTSGQRETGLDVSYTINK